MGRLPSFPLIRQLLPLERRLASSFAILSLGTGLSLSLLAVYLVRYLHLGAAAYGLGMSVAALCGMISGPLTGRLADRRDGYRTYAGLVWIMALATASLAIATKWPALVLLSLLVICGRGSAAVMGALIGQVVPADRRVRYRAVVKTVSNAAMLTGFGLSAIVLSINSRLAFRLGFLLEAATLGTAGLLVLTAAKRHREASGTAAADSRQPKAGAPGRRWQLGAARDGRFLVLTLLNGVILLYSSVFSVALPLWITSEARSLLWLVSVTTAVNTCVVLLLQVPMSRGITDIESAARAGRRGAILIGIGILMFPLAGAAHGNAVKAVLLVTLALLVAIGEVLYSVGSWELVYRMSPEESLGEYQGLFNMGLDVSMLLAPALFGWLAAGRHVTGWIAVAAAFIVCALLLRPVAGRTPNPRAEEAVAPADDPLRTSA